MIRGSATASVAAGVLALGLAPILSAERPAGFLGDWHGSSTCVVKPSACHDEEALYHVKAGVKPGTFLMQADKIVEGKPEMIGPPAKCSNKEKDVLHCEFSRGFLDLTLRGDHLDGAMFLSDKTRWREIKLIRVKK